MILRCQSVISEHISYHYMTLSIKQLLNKSNIIDTTETESQLKIKSNNCQDILLLHSVTLVCSIK